PGLQVPLGADDRRVDVDAVHAPDRARGAERDPRAPVRGGRGRPRRALDGVPAHHAAPVRAAARARGAPAHDGRAEAVRPRDVRDRTERRTHADGLDAALSGALPRRPPRARQRVRVPRARARDRTRDGVHALPRDVARHRGSRRVRLVRWLVIGLYAAAALLPLLWMGISSLKTRADAISQTPRFVPALGETAPDSAAFPATLAAYGELGD